MTMNADDFKRECEARTVNERARFLQMAGHQHEYDAHAYMFTAIQSLIDLIGYYSDDTIDEWQNELLCVIDNDHAEEILCCGYDNNAFANARSAAYRSFATEVDAYAAIRVHMTPEELTLLSNMVDNVWDAVDDGDADLEAVMRHEFNVAATWLEQRRIK